MAVYPLSLLPTVADDPNKMDSRRSLPFIMTLMKNTLLRGLNNVYRIASTPRMTVGHPDFPAFVEYVNCFCDMLQLHFEGDVFFFTRKNENGICLNAIMSPTCVPSTQVVREHIAEVKASFERSDHTAILINLEALGRTVASQMRAQLAELNYENVIPVFSDDKFKEMVLSSMAWFEANSDVSFVLPFVLSHHDPTTSPHWPTIPEQGFKALPDLMRVHSRCWIFAPFHPIFRQEQVWQV